MPATPNLALPYPAASDTADVPRDIQALAVKLDVVAGGPAVTSLPGSPVDGQECYYVADATSGVVWHLRYRSAASGASKWEMVGGPDLEGYVGTQEAPGVGAAWVDLATVGPSLTAALAGTYDLDYGAGTYFSGTNAYSQVGVAINLAAPAADNQVQLGSPGTLPGLWGTLSQRRRVTLAAGDALRVRYQVTAGASGFYRARWLRLRPVRVG